MGRREETEANSEVAEEVAGWELLVVGETVGAGSSKCVQEKNSRKHYGMLRSVAHYGRSPRGPFGDVSLSTTRYQADE